MKHLYIKSTNLKIQAGVFFLLYFCYGLYTLHIYVAAKEFCKALVFVSKNVKTDILMTLTFPRASILTFCFLY